MIAQSLILRTFQTVFYGNELSYAVLLASWLFWVGAGSLLATAVFSKRCCHSFFLPLVFSAVALAIPCLVFGIGYIKVILNVAPGQLIGVIPMFVSAMIVTAPAGFFVGVIFVLLCDHTQDASACQGGEAGMVYFFEALGSAAGGMVFSFFLLRVFHTTMIAWITAAMMMIVLIGFYRQERKISVVLGAFMLLIVLLMSIDLFYNLNFLSHQKQWPFGQLLAVEDSPYANITVMAHEGDVSFYENGILSFTSGDQRSAEMNVHFPLLAHPSPAHVLLVGHGLGGELREIMKYPEIQADFVQIDARLLDLARQYLPNHQADILQHPRLTVYSADARHFVRTTPQMYDVIIVNVGDPYTLGMNRYYTLEFFLELTKRLHPGGIVSLRVSSSENYLSQGERMFLRSLHTTLRQAFVEVRSIPGETHTFLASPTVGAVQLNLDQMSARMAKAGVVNRFMTEHTLPFLLDERRMQEVETMLANEQGLLNRDLYPRAYLFSLLIWAAHFDMGLNKAFVFFDLPFWVVLLVCAALLAGIGLWKTRRMPHGGVDLAVAVTGFSEIIFEIIVILAFQSLYGIAYHWISFILASFMLGLVVGSQWAVGIVRKKGGDVFVIFRRIQMAVIVYPMLLPFLLIIFRDTAFAQRWIGAASLTFASLPLIAGALGGLQYPLATALRRQSYSQPTEAMSGGTIYAYDAFGAAVGALITGIFLIPIFGIVAVCFLCIMMSSVALIFLWRGPASRSVM